MPSHKATYKAQMCCFNCGLLEQYDIPVRREIIGYERYWLHSPENPGQPELKTRLSCTQRANGTDRQALTCSRCMMGYLQPAFYIQPVGNIISIGEQS